MSTTNFNDILERERKAKIICSELNNFTDLKPTITVILRHLKELTGVEAVGIRIHDDGDYPYFVYDGFSEDFIEKESSLCAKDFGGKRIPNECGKGYLLECMCGNIIQGRFDPTLSFFSKNGSFWTNSTSGLLDNSSAEDRQSLTRNRCNSQGYESVALIPILAKDECIGLIQFNDKQKDVFTKDLIEYLEMIGKHIGIAIQNSLVHTKLKKYLDEIKVLKGLLPICAWCKKIRDDKGYWENLEQYITKHTTTEFTHSICPECTKKQFMSIDSSNL